MSRETTLRMLHINLIRNYTDDKNRAFAKHMDLQGPIPGITAMVVEEIIRCHEQGLAFGVMQSCIVDLSTKRDSSVINQKDHTVTLKFKLDTFSSQPDILDRVRPMLHRAKQAGWLTYNEYTLEIYDI